MRLKIIIAVLLLSSLSSDAQQYFIGKANDMTFCKIVKEYPGSIRVGIEGVKGKTNLKASEITEYKFRNVPMVAKKVLKQKDSMYLFFPKNRNSFEYLFSDPRLKTTSNGKTSFYEIVSYGSPDNMVEV
ncbi:MAG TPA: hypothetical protein VGN63_11975 [Flavisolibacter sp.]|nr:hypothetical protein [Flavisolibacter sp.]